MSLRERASQEFGHSREAVARAKTNSRRARCHIWRMTQFAGEVTVRLTVGLVLVVPVLLEITPFVSTPVTVKVYVLLGVTPFGVVVEVVLLLPQAGIRKSAPLITKSASSPHAFRDFFPPATAPKPTSASRGNGIHTAQKLRGCATAPVVVGPDVLMVRVEVATAPFTTTGFLSNEHTGGIVTKGVIVLHDSVTPGVPAGLL